MHASGGVHEHETGGVIGEHGHTHGHLQRTVGFWGLMFVSLGSIIGSGWLLSALTASETAGPAAIISWALAAVMLTVLALVYAELGATYPVAGGTGRFPYFSHGPLAGFVAGWSSWLQAVLIAPIEVLAAIAYANSLTWVQENFNMIYQSGSKEGLLNGLGLVVATIGMALFTGMNLAGAHFMAESNSIVVIWKTAVPLLAIIVIAASSFHWATSTPARVASCPTEFTGFSRRFRWGSCSPCKASNKPCNWPARPATRRRTCHARSSWRWPSEAPSMSCSSSCSSPRVNPVDIAQGWTSPLGPNASADQGAWHTLAVAVGAGWLAAIIVIDGVVSPAGTGIVYVGTSARLSYALGEEREMPAVLASVNKKGTPVVSILLAFVIGLAAFGPFPQLEQAGQRGDWNDRDHVRVCPDFAGCAAQARS